MQAKQDAMQAKQDESGAKLDDKLDAMQAKQDSMQAKQDQGSAKLDRANDKLDAIQAHQSKASAKLFRAFCGVGAVLIVVSTAVPLAQRGPAPKASNTSGVSPGGIERGQGRGELLPGPVKIRGCSGGLCPAACLPAPWEPSRSRALRPK
jgi:hypothetical protein